MPALSRRATVRATERRIFISEGASLKRRRQRVRIRIPDDMVLLATGRGGGNERESIGAAGGAAPRQAMLNGIAARARQEHPRGEDSIGMNSVVGILKLDSSWALLSYMCEVACESALDKSLDKLAKLLARKWETTNNTGKAKAGPKPPLGRDRQMACLAGHRKHRSQAGT